jgi:hypothetical protein
MALDYGVSRSIRVLQCDEARICGVIMQVRIADVEYEFLKLGSRSGVSDIV